MAPSSILEIRERIRLLAAIDRDRRVFGASVHGYELAPALSDAELAELERRLGPLPEEYRRFVQTLGAYGAGPYYGLVPPEPPILLGGDGGPDPARPFLGGAETAHDAPPPGGAHLLDGTVALADNGCGGRSLLVLRGPHAGEIWIDWTPERGGVVREARSLLEWYQQWLDLALLEWLEVAAPGIALDGPSDPAELEAVATGFELVERWARRHPRLLRTLGYLHLRERRWADADAAFAAAAAAGDEEPASRFVLDRARLAIVRGDPEHAIALVRRGLAAPGVWHATRDELRDVLERALAAVGRADEALAILDERAADSQFSLALHHRLVRERLARGDHDGAGAALERAARMVNILGEPQQLEARVSACFEPIIAELRAAGRTRAIDVLVARATLILEAN
ncbi:MAG TPA: SMI1/KNR4 family protein [Kofleriaceae bacterium]|nr:SMI1/KNR4 family protein [Kofleriaceae bacterium]